MEENKEVVIFKDGFFNFDFDGINVRAILDENGNPWFVGNDIASALGYKKPRNAVKQHCKYAKLFMRPDLGPPPSGEIPLPLSIGKLIPEPDLYRLVMRSELPNAESFQDKVVEEILPAIRKYGGYISNVDLIMNTMFGSLSKEEIPTVRKMVEEHIKLQNKVALDAPKIEFYEALMESSDSFDIGTTAKILNFPGIGRNIVFKILRERGIFMEGGEKHNQPKQDYINRGWFKVVPKQRENTGHFYTKVYVFGKGMKAIRNILNEDE